MEAMDTDERREEVALDVEAYASQFSGHAKIDRLLFIAKKTRGQQLEIDALRLAAEELRKTEERAAQLQNKLDADLIAYKNQLIKESIRMGNNDLGDFFYSRGDLQNALRYFLRTRDYCTSPKHITHMCLQVMRVANESNVGTHVLTYASRARQTPGAADDVLLMAKTNVLVGLAHLKAGKYADAASSFLKVSSELGSSFDDVIAPQEIATYGVLLALASFPRKQLRTDVVDNVGFREFLESVPEVREMVLEFYRARYAPSLTALERLKPTLLLDMHLHEHLDALCKSIRSKALVQFVEPFTSLNLAHAAAALNTSVPGVQQELEPLIAKGSIDALIDSHSGVLYARRREQRAVTFREAMTAGAGCVCVQFRDASTSRRAAEAYVRDAKAQLLRGSLLRYDQVQKGGTGGGGGAGALPAQWRERADRRDRGGGMWPELANLDR